MVGEEGPELAYMPPARIYNAGDTRAMQSGGGGNADAMAELLEETKLIRKNSDKTENRIYKLERILDDWDRNGAPVVNQPDTVLEVAP